jgi:hypothetical protein
VTTLTAPMMEVNREVRMGIFVVMRKYFEDDVCEV